MLEEADDPVFVLDFTHNHDLLVVVVRCLESVTGRRERAIGVELECPGKGVTCLVVDAEDSSVKTQEREEPSNGKAELLPGGRMHFYNHPNNARECEDEYREEDVQEKGVRAELWIHIAMG